MRLPLFLYSAVLISSPAVSQTIVERFPPQGAIPGVVTRTAYPIANLMGRDMGQTITVGNAGLLTSFEIMLAGVIPTDASPIVTVSLFDGVDGKSLGVGAIPVPQNLSYQNQWYGFDIAGQGIFLNDGQQIFATVEMNQMLRPGLDVAWYGWAAPEGLQYDGGQFLIRNDCEMHSHVAGCGIWFKPTDFQGLSIDMSYRMTIDTSVQPHAVPEPLTWALMITGFGMVGAAARIRHREHAQVNQPI
ncbi:PEPxxWA-CTERM sorting domain-containing protein [Sandaracinobacter sp. RS1-74]|uniref:PEPxxWA-CTERM sorting domain-containing protein n=1 Tax=Sandaracinobacteroides sayramensis TaxID=2913411 RepID=UPI001EDC3481|nr:PEPxxWA-CTERM sorting domain-containing protein [Sandaracinobacteroides sayramensis]MCG2841429.1 PEPxxWA-CTERM sorting domain-containing protein [Sandaracinobacteroides sayramensis]